MVVPFDAHTVASFLQIPYDPAAPCAFDRLYTRLLPTGHQLYREEFPTLIEQVRMGITRPYSGWIPKDGGAPDKLHMRALDGECRFWHTFVNSNILPSSNLTDVNIERAALLYTIVGEERLNIAQVLSDRIYHMVSSSRRKELLGFASLINKLCVRAGVFISDEEALDVKPAQQLTLAAYDDHLFRADAEYRKRAAKIVDGRPPSPRVPRVPLPPPPPGHAPAAFAPVPPAHAAHAAPPPPAPGAFDFYDLQQRLIHLSLQNDALYRQNERLSIQHDRLFLLGEFHSQFLVRAFPSVDYAPFLPAYPVSPPEPVYPPPYTATPPGAMPMPPRPFFSAASHSGASAGPSFAPRPGVYDRGDESEDAEDSEASKGSEDSEA